MLLATVTLAGCGSANPDAPVATSATSAAPTQTSEPKADLGDVTVKTGPDGEPVVITDEAGSYQKITISPDAAVFNLDKSEFDSTVAAVGRTDEDVLSAQRWVMTFLAEEGLDSIAVDGLTGWDDWKTSSTGKYLAPEWAWILDEPSAVSDRAAFIYNNPNNKGVTMIRDGLPRLSTASIALNSVKAYEEQGGLLVFSGLTTADYRITDAEALKYLNNNGKPHEAAVAEWPQFGDGVDGTFTLTFTFTYGVRKDATNGWLITGYENDFKHL